MTQHLGVPPQPWAGFQSHSSQAAGQTAAAVVPMTLAGTGQTSRLPAMVSLTIALRYLAGRAG